MSDSAIKKAIQGAGGQGALASACCVSYQAVQRWLRTGCPAERVLTVEKASKGAVTRCELRPDIYPLEESAA